jgi:hypothetical protein
MAINTKTVPSKWGFLKFIDLSIDNSLKYYKFHDGSTVNKVTAITSH